MIVQTNWKKSESKSILGKKIGTVALHVWFSIQRKTISNSYTPLVGHFRRETVWSTKCKTNNHDKETKAYISFDAITKYRKLEWTVQKLIQIPFMGRQSDLYNAT